MVNFDVGKNRPKLIGYHSNVPRNLRNLCQFYNPYICIYQRWIVGKDWFSSCWDIRWYRPISVELQHNFHFLPHFNSKTSEPIFAIFTRCRAVSGAINARIRKTIVHPILKCQRAEWRLFRKFCPKLVAMSTSLEISKKEFQINFYTQNAFIRWKDCEDRSSGSWDNLSPRNH